MGVVTTYGEGYKAPTAINAAKAVFAEGQVRSIVSRCAIANGDSANSLLYFGRVPSNALILPQSTLYHGTLTSLNDFDLGFYKNGAEAAAGAGDNLADGLDLTSGTSKSAVAAVTQANYLKAAWELAGLTSDPGGFLDIVGKLKADSGAAGAVVAVIYYAKQ